jgi:hypothetical protein
MIYIYGASDDLVEIDGDIREEFYYPSASDHDGYYITTSSGFVVGIRYDSDGEWAIRMKWVPVIWKSQFTIYPAGSELAVKYSGSDYSDVVSIDVDTDWVSGGTDFVKRVSE